MKYVLLLGFCLTISACAVKQKISDAMPVEHTVWDSLLLDHVDAAGWVNYGGFQRDSVRLNAYLSTLAQNHPNDKHWTDSEQLAYWINAYNAFTVKIVSDNYPVPGIKEIKKGIPFVNTVWDIKFIQIEDRTYDLNNIEHGIIRKQFDEPRIHFAVNCASVSCPALLNQAFVASDLDAQLDVAAALFINDASRNRTGDMPAKLSKIFSWFSGDFKKQMPLVEFVNQYADQPIATGTKIEYLDYDWRLNEQR